MARARGRATLRGSERRTDVQDDRLGEDAPVGSRGGTIVRHVFPVDGEYEISVSLARNRDDEYLGLARERIFRLIGLERKIYCGPTSDDSKSGSAIGANSRSGSGRAGTCEIFDRCSFRRSTALLDLTGETTVCRNGAFHGFNWTET